MFNEGAGTGIRACLAMDNPSASRVREDLDFGAAEGRDMAACWRVVGTTPALSTAIAHKGLRSVQENKIAISFAVDSSKATSIACAVSVTCAGFRPPTIAAVTPS